TRTLPHSFAVSVCVFVASVFVSAFFFQAEDGIRDRNVTGVQTCALPICTLSADVVILAAGALASPELLLRSGIGPAGELAEVGVESVHDLPGVGKNLHDHWLSPVVFSTGEHQVPMGEGARAVVNPFAQSRPVLPVDDAPPPFLSVPTSAQAAAQGALDCPGPGGAFALQGGLVLPASRGEVRLSGPNPQDPLIVDP